MVANIWRAGTVDHSRRISGNNNILTLNEPAGVLMGRDVAKDNIASERSKKRNTLAEEDGNARDNEALNKPGLQKSLNGDPTVHINVLNAAPCQSREDFRRVSGHAFYQGAGRSRTEWLGAENDHGLVAIWPGGKSQNGVERLTAYD